MGVKEPRDTKGEGRVSREVPVTPGSSISLTVELQESFPVLHGYDLF